MKYNCTKGNIIKIIHNTVRRKEIMKIRAEKPMFVFIENVNKIDKPPIRLSRRRKIQNTNMTEVISPLILQI